VNALIGFFQEERASQAIAALERLSAPTAKVTRDGRLMAVPARDLVPGDRIEIEAGDAISADARLIAAALAPHPGGGTDGRIDDSRERATAVVDAAALLGDRRTMIHAGTVVAAGRAARPSSWPRAWRPNLAISPACSNGPRSNRHRCSRLAELGVC